MGGAINFNNIFFGRHEKWRRIAKLIVIYLTAILVIYFGYIANAKQNQNTNFKSDASDMEIIRCSYS